jgi:hypothetical protein
MAGTAVAHAGRARNGFHEVDAGLHPVAFVAAEEKDLVRSDRPTEGAAELVLLKQRLRQRIDGRSVEIPRRIEVVAPVERVIAEVLEDGTREPVPSGLGDDRDLTAAAGAELRRVAVESTRNSCTFSRLACSLNDVATSPFRLPGAASMIAEPSIPS